MRICLLAYRGNPHSGGQGVYLVQLARALHHRGHRVEAVVGPPIPPGLEDVARVWPVPNLHLWGVYREAWLPRTRPLQLLHPLNLLEFALTRARFFPEPLAFSLRAMALLTRIGASRRFDVLHDVQTLGPGMWMMKALGLPVLTTVHHPLRIDRDGALARKPGFWERYHAAAFYPVGMQGWAIRRLHHVVTAAEAGKQSIMEAFGVPPERISVVPGGVDTAFFHNPGGMRRRANTLLFVGNSDDWKKGAVYLARALARLPERVRLRVVDAGAPERAVLPAEVERLGLGGRVDFLGKLPAEDLRAEYCRATLLVQPSLYEGLGLPAAEALACMTPVVATHAAAVPEVVPPGCGLLAPPGDPAALADAITTMLGDANLRKTTAEAGHRHVTTRLSWDAAVEGTEAVYRRLIQQVGGQNGGAGNPATGASQTSEEGARP